MSPKLQMSGLMRIWGEYSLYLCAMGALGAAAVGVGGHLTTTLVTWASSAAETKPRTLSRVEKHLAIKAAEHKKIRVVSKTFIAALTAPKMPPVALAAAIDRAETASPVEFPAEHAAYDIARKAAIGPVLLTMVEAPLPQATTAVTFSALTFSAPTSAPLVAGLACTAAGCTETTGSSMIVATASAIPTNWPKPSRLGKGKLVSSASATAAARPAGALERSKQARKLPTENSAPLIGSAQDPTSSPVRAIRIADSPGDIIHNSLRGTI